MHSATGSISPQRTKTTFFHKLKMKLCHYIHREIFFFYSGMGKGRIKIVVYDSNIMTKWANVFWHDRRLLADWIRWYKLHLTLALDGVSSIRLEGISHCWDIFFLRGHLSLSVWSLLSIPDAIYIWVALSVVTLLVLSFFKTLLRHGANPDLRDEDGKTPMDKARERNDEGHREVVHILQSPGIVFFSALRFEDFPQTSFSSIFTGPFCRIASFLQKILQELESCDKILKSKY